MSSGVRQRRRPERAAPPSVEVATMAAVLATASTSSSDGPAHPRRRSRSAGPRARAAPAQPAGKGDAGEAEFVPDAVAPAGNDGGATTGCDAQTSGARASDDWLDRWQAFVPWLVFILCAATRYYRIREPPGVVFDEYHFGRFTNQYNDRQFLFDIHPPLGKLVLFWVSRTYGYDHTVCEYEGDADEYDAACKFLPLRITAAAFGSLTAPIIYLIARNWGASVRGAILAACLLIFDGLNIGESRLILVDSQLMFWCAASLLTAQRWWARLNEHSLAEDAWEDAHGVPYTDADFAEAKDARLMSWRERWLWCIGVGAVTSSAISVKWTALATPGMIAIESFMALFFLRRAAPWADLLRVAAVAFALYSHWFYWHFQLGQKTADGDAFMPAEFQKTIPGNSQYDPDAPKQPFWPSFFFLNAEMLRANSRIDQRHQWDSVWWQWILNARGILYYSRPVPDVPGYVETVYLLGNPLIIWTVGAGVALGALAGLAWLRLRTTVENPYVAAEWAPFFTRVAYCLATYTINLLPYVAVVRSTFIYHYMPALMYGELLLALLLDKAAGKRWMPLVTKTYLLCAVGSFVFFSPWIYSIGLTAEGHARRRWLSTWD